MYENTYTKSYCIVPIIYIYVIIYINNSVYFLYIYIMMMMMMMIIMCIITYHRGDSLVDAYTNI